MLVLQLLVVSEYCVHTCLILEMKHNICQHITHALSRNGLYDNQHSILYPYVGNIHTVSGPLCVVVSPHDLQPTIRILMYSTTSTKPSCHVERVSIATTTLLRKLSDFRDFHTNTRFLRVTLVESRFKKHFNRPLKSDSVFQSSIKREPRLHVRSIMTVLPQYQDTSICSMVCSALLYRSSGQQSSICGS